MSTPQSNDLPTYEFDVFLSHSSADAKIVGDLAERLQAAGLRVWLDKWNIRPGDCIPTAIEKGLAKSRLVILCLSSAALGSEWVEMESCTAQYRDPSNRSRRFIPLLLSECEIPDTIKRFKYLDFRNGDEPTFKELLKECSPENYKGTKAMAPEAIALGSNSETAKPSGAEIEDKGLESLAITAQQKILIEDFRRQQTSGVVTFVFAEIVDAAKLIEDLGDTHGGAIFSAYHDLVKKLLAGYKDAKEIKESAESFLFVFSKPSDAIRFALSLQASSRLMTYGDFCSTRTRVGMHFGEVMVENSNGMPHPKNIFGKQVTIGHAIMKLAGPDQILLTKSLYENAFQILKRESFSDLKEIKWQSHGFYKLEGVPEPQEVFEIGESGLALLSQPPGALPDYAKPKCNVKAITDWLLAIGLKPESNCTLRTDKYSCYAKSRLLVNGYPAIIFQNCDGFLAVWTLDFEKQVCACFLNPSSTGDPKWKIVSAADFDGDGESDLLLQHEDGTLAVWLMKGLNLRLACCLKPSHPGNRRWRVVSTADVNKDGHTDIIFQHEDGTLAVWYMEGIKLIRAELFKPNLPSSADWKVVASGNFWASDSVDLLFQHTDGTLAVWHLDDNRYLDSALLSPSHPSDKAWRVCAATDIDGDGRPDLILQHEDGRIAIWLMNGTELRVFRLVNKTNRVSGWQIVGPN